MFRAVVTRSWSSLSCSLRNNIQRSSVAVCAVRHAHDTTETDAEFDARYEAFFNQPNIDGWDIRKGMNDLQGMDMVPEPKIIISAMKACRRVNDYSLAVRYLEAIIDKCGGKVNEIWPYVLKQIQPTLDELGVLTPEQMGYDKPELALTDVYDIH